MVCTKASIHAGRNNYFLLFLFSITLGQGRYQYFVDGSVYEGGFLNGLAHGRGSIRRPIKMKTDTAAENKWAGPEMSPSRRFVQREGDWREGKMVARYLYHANAA